MDVCVGVIVYIYVNILTLKNPMKKILQFVGVFASGLLVMFLLSMFPFSASAINCMLFDPVNPADYAKYCGDNGEKIFDDEGDIADWAKKAVTKMKNTGVINGYSDGSFGPNNYVTRAELATMLDRYSKKIVNENIHEFVFALDRAGYLNLKEDKSVQAALIMAEAGYYMLDEPPIGYNNGKPDPDEFYESEDVVLPSGYAYYHEVPYEFYLRYNGDRNVGQDSTPVDEWFGPFSVYDSAYKR